uniref:Uncharacterized protein n=1 Tax=Melopsittacus undulatus TaxID=13146 RepID=A0A8C6JQB3_MELUD
MALLCYNKGCGQRFDPEHNTNDSCLYHPGVPIFHDALKGWSCCKKRTTDFSEFLSIKGCTKGFHSKEKPPEPCSQGQTSDNQKAKPCCLEPLLLLFPSSDEPRQLLPIKVSRSLEQALEKLNLSSKDEALEGSWETTAEVKVGTTCKNAACKTYQGPESNTEVCTFHPGVPVFHEGMKYWSCCGVKTTDFSSFLEQPGCSRGPHCWAGKDKKAVSCRQDWHQTSSQVVVTVYAKNPLPALSSVKANRTVVSGDGRAGLGCVPISHLIFINGQELAMCLVLFDALLGLLLQLGLTLPTCCHTAESPLASLLQEHLPSHSGSAAFNLSRWLC